MADESFQTVEFVDEVAAIIAWLRRGGDYEEGEYKPWTMRHAQSALVFARAIAERQHHPTYRPDPKRANRAPLPPRSVLTYSAISVLEDAAEKASASPIERTDAHRLALGWLVSCGIALSWQADKFWHLLGNDPYPADTHKEYIRSTSFSSSIRHWKMAAHINS
ncbi:hypothetical protein D6851_02685 [Altericroceibacterium spongiae]|uniref:Uncharacterized protein n=1 Tax=Altericroceibacterium spongiae TaxID=2320269 RepID=A0A420ERR3_9SPHN|nr:hypothetical protein [Altericroceibacterium spongiae]RKF23396.1 hypothetical protein D6851_02685 [Altericroceibacterium spongiae]